MRRRFSAVVLAALTLVACGGQSAESGAGERQTGGATDPGAASPADAGDPSATEAVLPRGASVVWMSTHSGIVVAVDPLSRAPVWSIDLGEIDAFALSDEAVWAASCSQQMLIESEIGSASVTKYGLGACATDVAVAADGMIWVAVPDLRALARFDPALGLVVDAVRVEETPAEIRVDDGVLYVTSAEGLAAYEPGQVPPAGTAGLYEPRVVAPLYYGGLTHVMGNLMFNAKAMWTDAGFDLDENTPLLARVTRTGATGYEGVMTVATSGAEVDRWEIPLTCVTDMLTGHHRLVATCRESGEVWLREHASGASRTAETSGFNAVSIGYWEDGTDFLALVGDAGITIVEGLSDHAPRFGDEMSWEELSYDTIHKDKLWFFGSWAIQDIHTRNRDLMELSEGGWLVRRFGDGSPVLPTWWMLNLGIESTGLP